MLRLDKGKDECSEGGEGSLEFTAIRLASLLRPWRTKKREPDHKSECLITGFSHSQSSRGVLFIYRMRNRTAIRLLYVLAVLAGIFPPLLFLGYAFRQSMAEVEQALKFVSTGTLVQAESVLDTVSGTLRKVSSITQESPNESALNTLREAVFLDRYVQVIDIRKGNDIVCSTEQTFGELPSRRALGNDPLPAPGLISVEPPSATPDGSPQPLNLVYSFAPGYAVEGRVNPQLFSEFLDYYARESGARVYVYYNGGIPLTSFGTDNVRAPMNPGDRLLNRLTWQNGKLLMLSKSEKYPIYTVAIADMSVVHAKWSQSAAVFAVGGIVVSALLSGLVIRIAKRTQSLESDLREAVRFGEIDVHYQPLIDLTTGRCVGAEALMRWPHPRRGLIPASEFIDIAEKTDLILPMTDLILKKIAASAGPMLRKDHSLHIGINLAPQHFASTRILDAVKHASEAGLPAAQLIFEITERGLVAEENSAARTVMEGLAAAGAKLAVDDFGTGYSSLSYLQRFPLDYLKVDKAFVDGIDSETSSSGLVDQIIRIAKSLDLTIIAEGVEQRCQSEYLRARGVEFAQGWFFGRPMPFIKFEEFVRQRNTTATESEIADRSVASQP